MLLQTLGEHGLGLFAAPTVMKNEICSRYHVAWVGELDTVREKFYAILVGRVDHVPRREADRRPGAAPAVRLTHPSPGMNAS